MDYELTQHASDVLGKRQIPVEWLDQVFYRPEWVESDKIDEELEHRLGSIAEFEDRVLRVIVNKNAKPPRIITAYFDRGSRKK
ncbi:MAG: DUF4258 domain-containing protein [Candidatus Sumerlaeota bacterium]